MRGMRAVKEIGRGKRVASEKGHRVKERRIIYTYQSK